MWGTRALGCLAVLLVAGSVAYAGDLTFPTRPDGATNWIVDAAGMLDAGDAERVNAIARELLNDKQIPLLVVTIPALGGYGSDGSAIASYARALFDAWGVGSEAHNYGMLLLVAEGDRKARIELGAGWGRDHDGEANVVMSQLIVPRFREGEFSLGILDGVRGMDALARGESLPGPARPRWWWPMWIGLIIVVVAAGVSLHYQGESGFGYLLLTACGALVLLVMHLFVAVAMNRNGDGSGGGGSFGGGFSGGGGATGSW